MATQSTDEPGDGDGAGGGEARGVGGFNPLLVILNPRMIPECIFAFDRLRVAKCWITGMSEHDVEAAFASVVRNAGRYSHIVCISDDTVVKQEALDAVLDQLRAEPEVPATGWCNLDSTSHQVNLTKTPLVGDLPTIDGYDLYSWAEVLAQEPVFTTHFAGMCLTGMTTALWARFPFRAYGDPGYGSDWNLCVRLRDAGVPIRAVRAGFVFHVKETWNRLDKAPEKRLRLGEHRGITWEHLS